MRPHDSAYFIGVAGGGRRPAGAAAGTVFREPIAALALARHPLQLRQPSAALLFELLLLLGLLLGERLGLRGFLFRCFLLRGLLLSFLLLLLLRLLLLFGLLLALLFGLRLLLLEFFCSAMSACSWSTGGAGCTLTGGAGGGGGWVGVGGISVQISASAPAGVLFCQ